MVISNIFETDRYIVIRYYFRNPILLLYDKYDREPYLLNLEYEQNSYVNGIENDLDAGPTFIPDQYISENGREYIVGVIDPIIIKTIVSSESFKKTIPKYADKKKELEILAESLKETDNPVLMLIRMKR